MDGGKRGLWGGRMEWILYTIGESVVVVLGVGIFGLENGLRMELFECLNVKVIFVLVQIIQKAVQTNTPTH